MGIQLKPAANICFDAAAAAAGQAGGGGSRRRGPVRASITRLECAAGPGPRTGGRQRAGLAGPPAASPRQSRSRGEGCPGASCGAQTQLCGPPAPRPFDPGRGAVGSPQPGLEVTGQGQGQGGTDTDRTPGYPHSVIPHIYLAPTAVRGSVWRLGIEQ